MKKVVFTLSLLLSACVVMAQTEKKESEPEMKELEKKEVKKSPKGAEIRKTKVVNKSAIRKAQLTPAKKEATREEEK